MTDLMKQPQYIIEGIILRRLHQKRIEGYTIETAKEIAAAIEHLCGPTEHVCLCGRTAKWAPPDEWRRARLALRDTIEILDGIDNRVLNQELLPTLREVYAAIALPPQECNHG